MTLLAVSYAIHVLSAALWTGTTIYAASAVFPPARAGHLSPAAFERAVDGLLDVTRWTGLTLPATGLYQTWRLYPLDALVSTPRGWLVLGMFGLWGLMNGVLELGIYRMRTLDGPDLGVGRYMSEGFVTDGGVPRQAAAGWPYLLAAVGLAVLLLIDAGLLAAT